MMYVFVCTPYEVTTEAIVTLFILNIFTGKCLPFSLSVCLIIPVITDVISLFGWPTM